MTLVAFANIKIGIQLIGLINKFILMYIKKRTFRNLNCNNYNILTLTCSPIVPVPGFICCPKRKKDRVVTYIKFTTVRQYIYLNNNTQNTNYLHTYIVRSPFIDTD